jgi:hypothetical protein
LPALADLPAAWHLLSLDAPCVAVLWMYFFARVDRVVLHWTTPAAMFLAVWILYAADRLLDAAAGKGALEARHRFHQRHARLFLGCILVAAAALLPLIAVLPRAQFRLDLALGGLLLVWFGMIHLLRWERQPKEFAVGLFFATAVCVPEFAARPLLPLLLPAAAFALLCILNCLWIAAWEAGKGDPAPISQRSLRWLTLLLCASPVLAAVGSLPTPLAWATACSAFALLVVDARSSVLPRTRLRAAADLALLTPLLVLPLMR